MSFKNKLEYNKAPRHVAIIMDGNGRWAKQHKKDRIFGHYQGVNSVKSVVEGAVEVGIKYITLYAFSSENWNRPKEEVEGLMNLLMQGITDELVNLNEQNIRLLVIGQLDRLDAEIYMIRL